MKKLLICASVLTILLLGACKKKDGPAPDIVFTGKLTSSGLVNFKGLCTWSVEYVNSNFDIKLGGRGQTVLLANIATTMKEAVVSGGCTPPSQQSPHLYSLVSASVNGAKIDIYFKQDAGSFPQNEASFTGFITSSGITGKLTFYRKSDGIFCKVEMPFQLQKTN
jgi:hypothetical protein